MKRRDSSLIQDVLKSLEASGDEYRLLSAEEDERLTNWIETSFGTSWFRVRWSDVPGHECREWLEWRDRVGSVEQLIDERALGNPTVCIVWSNLLTPRLEISLDVARRHSGLIFAADFDTWIICETDQWLIEVYHEGEACFGTVPEV